MDRYSVVIAGKKMIGVMVRRVSSPSTDDIQLEFEDGTTRWFKYRQVTKV